MASRPGGTGLGHRDSNPDSGYLVAYCPSAGASSPLVLAKPAPWWGSETCCHWEQDASRSGEGVSKPGGMGALVVCKGTRARRSLLGLRDLRHSPISGPCDLAITAQSLFQKPQAVLTGLHRGRNFVTQALRLGEESGGQSCPPLTFTVSLGIFLLEASFRGQSSSVGKRGGSLHSTFCFVESPAHREASTPWEQPQSP